MANPQKQENQAEQKVEAAVAPEKKKSVIPLNQTRIEEASYKRNRWFVICPVGTNHADLLDPEFWRNCSTKLKPFDMIEAITEDGAWYSEMIVISASSLWAKLHVTTFTDLVEAKKNMPKTDDENHHVEWKGPIEKFAAIRKSDGATLRSGFNTQLEGWTWLDGHIKSMK